MKIKDFTPENRPLERLLESGEKSLSNAELFSIILKSGTRKKNVLEISNYLLSNYDIDSLKQISIPKLKEITGIGNVKASQIKAIFEISKRINNYKKDSKKLCSIKQAYQICKSIISEKKQENLLVICLISNKVVSKKILNIGTDNQTLFSVKDILRYAIENNSQGIILSHNHPSGENFPSREDRQATLKIKKALKEIEIQLLDHLIITKERYYSFRENRLL